MGPAVTTVRVQPEVGGPGVSASFEGTQGGAWALQRQPQLWRELRPVLPGPLPLPRGSQEKMLHSLENLSHVKNSRGVRTCCFRVGASFCVPRFRNFYDVLTFITSI